MTQVPQTRSKVPLTFLCGIKFLFRKADVVKSTKDKQDLLVW